MSGLGGVGRSGTVFGTVSEDECVKGLGISFNPVGAASSTFTGIPISATVSETSSILQYESGGFEFLDGTYSY